MRILRGAGFALLAVAMLAGCDTEQPTQSGSQNGALDFASYTTAAFVDVWDEATDTNHDGVFSDGDTLVSTFCGDSYPTQPDDNAPFLRFPALWAFAIEVKIIRAGQVTVEQVIPATGYTSIPEWQDDLTHYPTTGLYPPFPEAPSNGDFSQYVYGNPRRKVNTSSEVLECLGISNLPTPNLAGHPLPFEFTLAPGDTVVVTARRSATPLLPDWAAHPHSFDALLALDGVIVTPVGNTSTFDVDGIISFSYQVR